MYNERNFQMDWTIFMLILQTCISGLTDVVARALAEMGVAGEINKLDGALIYEADVPMAMDMCNNTFELLLQRPLLGNGALDQLMDEALKRRDALPLRPVAGNKRTFRIVSSRENTLCAVNGSKKTQLEQLIAKRTGLKPDRGLADIEYWLYSRSEGQSFLLRRLSYNRVTEKQLQKGELRPELCRVMNYLSVPTAEDIWLDPFSGSGALALARQSMGGYQKLYALDIDAQKAVALMDRLGLDKRIETACADIAHIGKLIPAGSVNKIVTDPPWGFYEQIDLPSFYQQMWQMISQPASKGARIVLLSARLAEMEQSIANQQDFKVKETYHILVNGKKACIYVIERT